MLGLISLLTTTAFGATLSVSADGTATYSTIQDAIDAASSGDTISLKGEYNDAFDFMRVPDHRAGTRAPCSTVAGSSTSSSADDGEDVRFEARTSATPTTRHRVRRRHPRGRGCRVLPHGSPVTDGARSGDRRRAHHRPVLRGQRHYDGGAIRLAA